MKKGKVLKIKFGTNPNSSSLGFSVLFVLMGSGLAYAAVALVSSLIRVRRVRKRPGTKEAEGSENR